MNNLCFDESKETTHVNPLSERSATHHLQCFTCQKELVICVLTCLLCIHVLYLNKVWFLHKWFLTTGYHGLWASSAQIRVSQLIASLLPQRTSTRPLVRHPPFSDYSRISGISYIQATTPKCSHMTQARAVVQTTPLHLKSLWVLSTWATSCHHSISSETRDHSIPHHTTPLSPSTKVPAFNNPLFIPLNTALKDNDFWMPVQYTQG